ncbi:hypothetical protein [uncultured Porphyromonas sp.]|uniref:hypothetical protein n=1 Tax=uncultured Porphyromonas sp. TaxID=159274 RepID=UPI002593FD5B|nr:hypothetical protein [uncultured Porphyromonas sp.]
MKEKFIFTDPGSCISECSDKLVTSIYGVRNVGDVKEGLRISVIIRTNAPASVVCRLYRNGELRNVEYWTSTDTMELGERVRSYIGDLEE